MNILGYRTINGQTKSIFSVPVLVLLQDIVFQVLSKIKTLAKYLGADSSIV